MITSTIARISVGRNADCVLKVADFDATSMFVSAALAEIKAGKSVGVSPRMPVNKKSHIAEAESLVKIVEYRISEGEVVAMQTRTLEVVQAELAETKEAMDLLEKDSAEGKIKYEAKVNMYNKLHVQITALYLELREISKHIVKVQDLNTLSPEDRIIAENSAKWKDRDGGQLNVVHHNTIIDHSKGSKNVAFSEIADKIDATRDQFIAVLPEFGTMVHQIVPFANRDRNDRVGHIVFQVPAGMLQVKQWTGQGFEWFNMENYDYNAFNSSRARLTNGSGFLKLAIKENADGVFVSWPKSKGTNNDVFYDVFMTRDPRFDFYNSDNNYNVQAALTAFVRIFWSEHKVAEPRNRFGFNEHCGNCRNMAYLPIHDQLGDDYENKANPIDTSELGQWGSQMPQWICRVHKDFTDADAINLLNESTSYETNSYIDNEGVMRWLRAGEVLVKGKPVHTYNIRAEGTTDRCARCPFYAKSERKPDKNYGKEVEATVAEYVKNGGQIVRFKEKDNTLGAMDMKAMKLFVPRYWTDRARPERMPVIVKHNDNGSTEWTAGFPGEFKTPVEFCVQGVGGITIYGTPAIMEHLPRTFVPTTEAYQEADAQVGKLLNYVHTICNQFATIEPGTLSALIDVIEATPAPVKEPLLARYKRTMQRLATTIQEGQQQQPQA